MRKLNLFFTIILFYGCLNNSYAQYTLTIKVESDEHEPLPGASATLKSNASVGATADEQGLVTLSNIPNGGQTIVVSFLGYETIERTLVFPRTGDNTLIFVLKEELGALEEVIVSTNRSGRDIESIPTRIEAIKDEVEEGVMMAPATASHILTHVAGVQVQTTSATSGTANVRLQGLSGRYTQILQDGFPLYNGFAGSLSILQIPPVDLQQVEFLKGPASTLYGTGAVAGVINLISKKPEAGKDETILHLNAAQIGQFDANCFVRQQFNEKIGFTMMASHNMQQAYDVNNDGFTELPEIIRFNFNSRLFWDFNKKTKGIFSLYLSDEVREGGDVLTIAGRTPDSTHFYREGNKTNRIAISTDISHELDSLNTMQLRSIFSSFKRQININENYNEFHDFRGQQLNSFTELTWKHNHLSKRHHTIAGMSFTSNAFIEKTLDSTKQKQNYLNEQATIFGLFIQHDWDISKKFSIEGGLRTDFTNDFIDEPDVFVLPRLAALYRFNSKWSSRFSAGLGYRLASVFEEETERRGYDNVLPLRGGDVEPEVSKGANIDFTFRTPIGKDVFFTWNQLFFYTRIDNPIYLAPAMRSNARPYELEMQNLDGYTDTKGVETNIKLTFGRFNIYGGYVYTDPITHTSKKETPFPLTSKHVIKGDFVWEVHGKYMFGIDIDYRTEQTLSTGRVVPSLLTGGFLARYTYNGIDFYFNTENITNQRQSQLDKSVLSPPYNTPQYTEVWAPQEGFVYNVGIRANITKATAAAKKK